MTTKKNIIIFTDGSCVKKNGVPIKCGYGVHFPNNELDDISKSYKGTPLTNQRAELYAIYKGIKTIVSNIDFDTITIYSDSEYSIKSITLWIISWKKNGWKNSANKDVANQDIIKKIDKYMCKYENKIIFNHVKAHTKNTDSLSKGNRMADKLATSGANKTKFKENI